MIKEFEREAVRRICGSKYSPEAIDEFLDNPTRIEVNDTGTGQYDLNIFHPKLSSDLFVCEKNVFGTCGDVKVGFMAIIINNCIEFECYMVDGISIPKSIRQREVVLSKT